MTKFITVFILSVFFILFASCNSVSPELKTAEQLIESAPDSALQILRNLPPQKYKNPKNRALYGLLMVQALDKIQLPLKPDSLLNYSIAFYQEYHDQDRLASCYLYKGRTNKYALQYETAMNFYLKALDETQNSKNNTLIGRINYDLGDIYIIQQEYTKARQKFKIAYTYFKKDKFQLLAFYSLLSIGRSYHETKDYEIAEKYFRKIYNYAKDSLQKGSLFQEMGLNFHDSKKLDSALVYYRKAIYFPYVNNNRAIRYCYMSNLFFNLNQIDSAFYYANKSFNYETDIRTQRECYRIMTNCEFIKGRTENVTYYMNKYVILGDSIRKIDTQTKGSVLETMHISKKKTEEAENRFRHLFILLFMLIGATVYIYIRKHRLNKQEKLQAEKEAEQIRLNQKIDIRKHEIEKHLDILLKKIQEKKTLMASERKKATINEKETMDIEIYNELLHFNNIGLFYREMDILLNNIVTKLKNGYPNLNEKEITWCCLYLLKISASDMFLLLDYTVNGLKKMRQRLALKMNLQGVSELYTLLDEMLYD